MKEGERARITSILKALGENRSMENITLEESKNLLKKLKRLQKDIETLKRRGGLTVVVSSDSVVTTYYNDTMNRKLNKNNKKLIY